MTLTKSMAEKPSELEVYVFRSFVERLMSFYKQLDHSYHTDGFLCDRHLTAVDIPAIHTTLCDRMPRSSQQAVQRVANQLSDKRSSAGYISA